MEQSSRAGFVYPSPIYHMTNDITSSEVQLELGVYNRKQISCTNDIIRNNQCCREGEYRGEQRREGRGVAEAP